MLDQHTGKVMHIDFGDCFEVALKRDKYPEKIPFRLTQMLINAMEVSGIDGTYRFTCENVMTVLRGHSESLLAVLETFVYDPLINWRLLVEDESSNQQPSPTRGSIDPENTPKQRKRKKTQIQFQRPRQPQQEQPQPAQRISAGSGEANPAPDTQTSLPGSTTPPGMTDANTNNGTAKHRGTEQVLIAHEEVSQATIISHSADTDIDPDNGSLESVVPTEELNQRALEVIDRIKLKLSGRDFKQSEVLPVPQQVNNLILQARSTQNLCACYVGWCPFW